MENSGKRSYGTGKNEELKIKIETENKRWLEKQAKLAGITMAEFVRRIILKEKKLA